VDSHAEDVLKLLRLRGDAGATTLELHEVSNDLCVSSTVSKLRKRGHDISCVFERTNPNTGRKIYRFKLTEIKTDVRGQTAFV
jgi:hypothetical protein